MKLMGWVWVWCYRYFDFRWFFDISFGRVWLWMMGKGGGLVKQYR
jgi:hypothetical protein